MNFKLMICSLLGHSRISTVCFGYRYCARCGDQLGDSLGSTDNGLPKAVIVNHSNDCKNCRANYKTLSWKDKIFCPNPFKEDKEPK